MTRGRVPWRGLSLKDSAAEKALFLQSSVPSLAAVQIFLKRCGALTSAEEPPYQLLAGDLMKIDIVERAIARVESQVIRELISSSRSRGSRKKANLVKAFSNLASLKVRRAFSIWRARAH